MKLLFSGILIIVLSAQGIFAQDSLSIKNMTEDSTSVAELHIDNTHQFSYKKLIIPATFIGYGVATLKFDKLKQLNFSTRTEINEHNPNHINLDNYTRFAPAALVYGLNALGVEGKHNLRDRSIIYGTSLLMTSAVVMPLKHIVKEERPDQSNRLSFPSGHTATAFASAQFMYREYKDVNFWLGISGYSFAVFTGVYRMLNDKHWFSDVVAGAGIGILSTEAAYWLYPKINKLFSGKNKNSSTTMMPFYQNKTVGIGLVKNF
ncbi:PAP2 superfamily protein [Chryseobacterium arachidis]|uniref:PAP2 superfamily protein n=1 Tax=Chryseobacterium arachidis TaxID=1416778 RepID=A0A1M5BWU7_9FLAO|nr:phosphatase PAP2 family protein [Chryseobacterium arachidis]SHF46850.1 PAP2 superfamily protein [Chryseobacterium arachidis]